MKNMLSKQASGSRHRWVYPAVLAVAISFATAVSAEDAVKDVSSDHWAYQAVQSLVSKGYLGLSQDGSFQGNKAVDRYTLANVVYKILNDIRSGKTATNDADVELLRKLSIELRDDLVTLEKRTNTYITSTNNELKKSKDATTVLQEDVTRLTSQVNATNKFRVDAERILSDLTKSSKENADRIRALDIAAQEEIARNKNVLLKELERTTARLDEFQTELLSSASLLKSSDSELSTRISNLANDIGKLKTDLGSKIERDNLSYSELSQRVDNLAKGIEQLSGKLDVVAKDIALIDSKVNQTDSARKADLQATGSVVNDTKNELNNLASRLVFTTSDFIDKLNSLDNRVTGVETQLRVSLESERAYLQTELAAAHAKIDGLKDQLDKISKQLINADASLITRYDEIKKGLSDLSVRSDNAAKNEKLSLDELKQAVSSIRADLERVVPAMTEITTGVGVLANRIGEVDKLRAEDAAIAKTGLDNALLEIRQLSERLAFSASDLSGKLSGVEQRVQYIEAKIQKDLEEQRNELISQISNADMKIKEIQSLISSVEERLGGNDTEMSKTIANVTNELANYKNKLIETEFASGQHIDNMRAAISEVKAGLEEITNDVNSVQRRLDEVARKSEVQAVNATITDLSASLEDLKQQLSQSSKDSIDRIRETETRVNALENKFKQDLEEQKKELISQIISADSRTNEIKGMVGAIEAKLGGKDLEMTSNLDNISKELQVLKSNLEKAEITNTQHLDDVRKTINTVRMSLEDVTTNVESIQKRLEDVARKNEVDTVNSSLNNLSTNLENLKQQVSASSKSTSERLAAAESRLTAQDEKFNGYRNTVDTSITTLTSNIDSLRQQESEISKSTNERLAAAESRLATGEGKFNEYQGVVNSRFTDFDKKFADVDKRFNTNDEKFDEKFNDVNSKLQNVADNQASEGTRLNTVIGTLNDKNTAQDEKIAALESRVTQLEKVNQSLSEELKNEQSLREAAINRIQEIEQQRYDSGSKSSTEQSKAIDDLKSKNTMLSVLTGIVGLLSVVGLLKK